LDFGTKKKATLRVYERLRKDLSTKIMLENTFRVKAHQIKINFQTQNYPKTQFLDFFIVHKK
jgi:hypothetical protein